MFLFGGQNGRSFCARTYLFYLYFLCNFGFSNSTLSICSFLVKCKRLHPRASEYFSVGPFLSPFSVIRTVSIFKHVLFSDESYMICRRALCQIKKDLAANDKILKKPNSTHKSLKIRNIHFYF